MHPPAATSITRAIGAAWPYRDPLETQAHQLATNALDWFTPMDRGVALEIAAMAHGAADALTRGLAVESDLHNLAVVANMALLLAEMGYGPETIPAIQDGSAAIVRTHERYRRVGRVGCSGQDLMAISELAHIHDAQLDARPDHCDLVRASREVSRRMRAGLLTGKVPA